MQKLLLTGVIAATVLVWNQGLNAATESMDNAKSDAMHMNMDAPAPEAAKNPLDEAQEDLKKVEKDIEEAKAAESKMPAPEAAPKK